MLPAYTTTNQEQIGENIGHSSYCCIVSTVEILHCDIDTGMHELASVIEFTTCTLFCGMYYKILLYQITTVHVYVLPVHSCMVLVKGAF